MTIRSAIARICEATAGRINGHNIYGRDLDTHHSKQSFNPPTSCEGPIYYLKGLPLTAVTALMLLAVGAVSVWNSYNEYTNIIAKEYKLSEVRARQREARISGALHSVDLMLANIIQDFADNPRIPPFEHNNLLRKMMRQLPELRNMLIVDSAGRICAEALESSIGADASQREYFNIHKSNPDNNSFFISRPFKSFSGLVATTLSRVIKDNKGRFNGVAIASIESAFFADALKINMPDPDVHVLLINKHGDILSAFPNVEWVGRSLTGDIAYEEHNHIGRSTSRHLNASNFDGIKRLSLFHDFSSASLSVVVLRDYDSILNEWRTTTSPNLLSYALLAVTTVLLLMLAGRRQRSLSIARQIIAEREGELRAIIETEPECVKQLAANGTLLSMNRAGLDMIEANSLDQVIGQKVDQLILPEHREAFTSLTQQVFEGKSGNLVFEIQGMKGTRRWLETKAVPLHDSHNNIVALLSVTRDITDNKRHKVEQENARQLLETQLSEITKLQAELKNQLIRDPLTDLYNRRYLNETLLREFARAHRDHYPLALVMLDLDHFKKINDSYGHAAGDGVLKELSAILRTGAREGDIVCRYGGEEFLVAMPNTTIAQAQRRADSWRLTLLTSKIIYNKAEIYVSLSAGVAGFPDHGNLYEEVMSCADKALYKSKADGRNCVTCFSFGDALLQINTQSPDG